MLSLQTVSDVVILMLQTVWTNLQSLFVVPLYTVHSCRELRSCSTVWHGLPVSLTGFDCTLVCLFLS